MRFVLLFFLLVDIGVAENEISQQEYETDMNKAIEAIEKEKQEYLQQQNHNEPEQEPLKETESQEAFPIIRGINNQDETKEEPEENIKEEQPEEPKHETSAESQSDSENEELINQKNSEPLGEADKQSNEQLNKSEEEPLEEIVEEDDKNQILDIF